MFGVAAVILLVSPFPIVEALAAGVEMAGGSEGESASGGGWDEGGALDASG